MSSTLGVANLATSNEEDLPSEFNFMTSWILIPTQAAFRLSNATEAWPTMTLASITAAYGPHDFSPSFVVLAKICNSTSVWLRQVLAVSLRRSHPVPSTRVPCCNAGIHSGDHDWGRDPCSVHMCPLQAIPPARTQSTFWRRHREARTVRTVRGSFRDVMHAPFSEA